MVIGVQKNGPGRQAASQRQAAGFTLMELMVVTMLLAIMALMVTPIFRGSLSGARADHSMRDLYAAMKSAQAGAVTEGVEHRIYLEPDKNWYWSAHAAFSPEGDLAFEPLPGRSGEVVELPRNLEMDRPSARPGRERGTYYFSFFPSGGCDISSLTVSYSDEPRRKYLFETTGTTVYFEVPES